MTQNLKSLLKLAFKNKNTTSATKKKKKLKNFLKFSTTKSSNATSTSNESETPQSNYLTRYDCKNKKIINSKMNDDELDETISNILPFKAIPTQILIPPPVPTATQTPTSMMPMNEAVILKNQIETRLNQATQSKPANIPMLVIKSYKMNSNINLKQINVNKGCAVNALYMLSNSWIYVKTFNDNEGFIPKYCCEPFGTSTSANETNMIENTNHTYISIIDNTNTNELIEQNSDLDMETDNLTNLSLFSVSRCLNIDSTILTTTTTATSVSCKTTTTTKMKAYSKKFYFKSTVNNHQYNLRRKSNSSFKKIPKIINTDVDGKNDKKLRSRNRKLTIAYKQIPNEMTLTMLENNFKYSKQQQQEQQLRRQQRQRQKHVEPVQIAKTRATKKMILSNSLSSGSSITSNETINNYDFLMKCSSTTAATASQGIPNEPIKAKYTKQDSKLTLYQVLFDYIADFKDDLSVKKGDVVFAIDDNLNKNYDWIYVRPYNRKNLVIDDCDGGFIPRDYVLAL